MHWTDGIYPADTKKMTIYSSEAEGAAPVLPKDGIYTKAWMGRKLAGGRSYLDNKVSQMCKQVLIHIVPKEFLFSL